MSEETEYLDRKEKLGKLCAQNDLVYRFRYDVYPITLTIRPFTGVGKQLSMLEEEKGFISPDAALVFILENGEVRHNFHGTFTVSETLFRGFLTLFKSMTSFWLQFFFRECVENNVLLPGKMPVIDPGEAE